MVVLKWCCVDILCVVVFLRCLCNGNNIFGSGFVCGAIGKERIGRLLCDERVRGVWS